MPAPRITNRSIFLAVFLLSAAMLGVGYLMQYGMGLEPCPLCMTQRAFILFTGVTAAIAALHGPRRLGSRIYAGLALMFSLVGAGFSGRHLWLQSLPPDRVPACGPSVDYILDTFPPLEALEILLRGTGDCAKVDWSLFGISIPGWTLLGFAVLAIGAVLTLYTRPVASK
jgi:protein dithiol:quinone oxidoreductase